MIRPVVLSNENAIEVLRKEALRHETLAQAFDRAADLLEGKTPAQVSPTAPKPRPLPTATGGGYY